MKPENKIDPALIVGLGIPVVMIVLIATAVIIPRFLMGVEDPCYDFLYTIGYAEGCRVFVEDDRLRKEAPKSDGASSTSPVRPQLQFFIHHVRDNTSERLSFEQASDLRLDDTAFSPDGYEIVYGRKTEFLFPMWSHRDYRTRFLRKGGRAIKLELEIGEDFRYANNMTFLGWIEE